MESGLGKLVRGKQRSGSLLSWGRVHLLIAWGDGDGPAATSPGNRKDGKFPPGIDCFPSETPSKCASQPQSQPSVDTLSARLSARSPTSRSIIV
jgi:hypothetical protein